MKKVFLDPGHGGKDPGAVGNGLQEKDINLSVALKIGDTLKRHNVEVFYSRTTDVFIELTERSTMANKLGGDVFVSVHVNATDKEQPQGLETFSYHNSKNGTALAKCIQDSILDDKLYTKNRGIKTANFSVLRNTKMTAALVELAFISNKEDAEILRNKQIQLAESVAKGILNFLGIKYVKDSVPTTTEKSLYKVQVGAYSIKSNAENLLIELKSKGFNGFITEEKSLLKEEVKTKSNYYEKEGLKIIETSPDNIYITKLEGKTLREIGVYGINGTWQNNIESHLTRSIWGLAINNNKAIGPNSHQNSPNGVKRGTIIYYEDGSIEVKLINNMSELSKSVKWAIGGGMLFPKYDPISEKIASDILRNTAHTGIGYKCDRIYLIVHSGCSMSDFKIKVGKLNLDGAIFLDGGGSTQMYYTDNKGIHSNRKLSHGVFIKEEK